MLLVAVTAPIGGGKSSLAAALAKRLLARGVRVEGLLALAGDRAEAGRGASRYDLVFLPDGKPAPWAERDETRRPPYAFSEETSARVREWADGLVERTPEVVILDEFGKMEAQGGGLFPAWEGVVAAAPPLVVIAVRTDNLETIQAGLARPFDLVVPADGPKAIERLAALADAPGDWAQIGVYGAGAGALEATLGSALHGARIPLRGQALSTLQALVLTSAAEGLERRERVAWVAVVAAGLKALSPAGSRLRPMLAITVQGVLFALAVRLLGWRPLAVFVGGIFIGAWAAGQTLLLQWLLVGSELFRAYDVAVRWVAARLGAGAPALPAILGTLVAVSALVTGTITLAFWRRRGAGLTRLTDFAERHRHGRARSLSPWLAALRDVLHPAFWAPIAIILAILLASGTAWESALWTALRALALGLTLYGLVRLMRVHRLGLLLRRRGLYGPAAAVERALRE